MNGWLTQPFQQCWRFVQVTKLSKCTPIHRIHHNDVKTTIKIWYLSIKKQLIYILRDRIKKKMCNSWHRIINVIAFIVRTTFIDTLLGVQCRNWHYLHTNRLDFLIRSITEFHWCFSLYVRSNIYVFVCVYIFCLFPLILCANVSVRFSFRKQSII